MAYERREETVSTAGGAHERTEHVVEAAPAAPRAAVDQASAVAYDPYAEKRAGSYKMVQTVYLIFGVMIALIAIRFVLQALGADPRAGFAQFIFAMTNWLVAPFHGLFGAPAAGAAVLDTAAIVAMVVYALLAWVIAKALWLMFGETRSATKTAATSVDTHVH